MREMVKIIFLDIDGVLNGYDFWEHINYTLWKYCPFKFIKKKLRSISNYSDIDKKRVKRLSKICKATGAKIVLSSSWRNHLLSDTGERFTDFSDAQQFWNLVDKYNIEVIGKTPQGLGPFQTRQDEIISWLTRNQNKYNVASFVILDDEASHLQCFIDSNLIKTSYKGYMGGLRCRHGEWIGLDMRHVKEAIHKLNIGVNYNIHQNEMEIS